MLTLPPLRYGSPRMSVWAGVKVPAPTSVPLTASAIECVPTSVGPLTYVGTMLVLSTSPLQFVACAAARLSHCVCIAAKVALLGPDGAGVLTTTAADAGPARMVF